MTEPNPLKEILDKHTVPWEVDMGCQAILREETLDYDLIQDLKAYFLDLIGEDEQVPQSLLDWAPDDQRKYWQTKLKKELREKLK